MFTRSRRTRRELGAKDLGQAYDQPEQVMERMNNYAIRPRALPFLYISQKHPLGSLVGLRRDSRGSSFCKSSTCEPMNRVIGNISREFKGEALTIKKEGYTKSNDAASSQIYGIDG